MRIAIVYILASLLLYSCKKEETISTKLEGKWELKERFINQEIQHNPDSLFLIFSEKDKINVNGYKTTYEVILDGKAIYFDFGKGKDYSLEILELNDSIFHYKLQDCDFNTIEEKLLKDDNN